jgi:hypothetical protein
VTGDHYEGQLRILDVDIFQDFNTSHHRHFQVTEDELDFLSGEGLQGFGAVDGSEDLVA